MKNMKTKATALALSTLMAVSAIGTVSAGAVTSGNTTDTSRTIYFINNKDWSDVYGYAWDASGSVTKDFPGEELTALGTTTQLGTSHEVYSMTVNPKVVKGVLFDAGGEHREQTPDILLDGTPVNCFYLSDSNDLMPFKDFQTSEIKPMGGSTTPSTPSGKVDYIGQTKPLSSDGTQTMYVNTQFVGSMMPTVTFIRTGGSVAAATSVKQMRDGNDNYVYGVYEVQVPQGTFQAVDIQTVGFQYRSDVNDATDTVKITSDGKAVPCQRVYFNNNLSNMYAPNQIVRAYAWNSVANVPEVSFDWAKEMTYLMDDMYGVDVYFYDVPLTCDSIIFFTTEAGTRNVTAQTQDVKLRLTTNTDKDLAIDGYFVSNKDNVKCQSVSLYDQQVRI